MPSLIDSQEAVDWNGLMVVMAFKIAGSRAARQPHVIYQFYDKDREEHYNLISALDKAMRECAVKNLHVHSAY
jgi:replication-associated recombination protein RarA